MIFPDGFFHGFDDKALKPYADFLRSRRLSETPETTQRLDFNNLDEMINTIKDTPDLRIFKIYQERRVNRYDHFGDFEFFYTVIAN